MKKVSKKVLAMFLAITMVFTLAMSVSAFTVDDGKITPEVLYTEGMYSSLGVLIDGNFYDYGTTEKPIELWYYDYETEAYVYQCDISGSGWEAVFQMPEFDNEPYDSEELAVSDITGLIIYFSEIQDELLWSDSYKLVFPEDLLVTEDGQSNNAFDVEFDASEVITYEETIFDRILNWIYELPSIIVFFLQPIVFIIQVIQQILGFVPVPLG